MSIYITDLQTSIPIVLSSNVSQIMSLNMAPGYSFGGLIRYLLEVTDPNSTDVIQAEGGAVTLLVATPETLSPITSISKTLSGQLVNTGTLSTTWSIDATVNPVLVNVNITSTGITNPVYTMSVSPLNVAQVSFNLGVPS